MGRVSSPLLILLAIVQMGDCPRVAPSLNLLNADVRKYAPFIVKGLYHDPVTGTLLAGLSETEKLINGDNWFWTDDNAKSLEALTLAPIFADYAAQAGKLVEFIIANSPPPFVFRRRTDERLEVKSAKPEDFQVVTGLMNFHGNLRQAEIRQGYRFHDDRNEDATKYSADFVRYSFQGKTYSADVKQTIVAADVHREERAVTLSYNAELRADAAVAGSITYSYKVEIDKPYLATTITVNAGPASTLSHVEATMSLDQLDSLSNVRYSKFFGYLGSAASALVNAADSTKPRLLQEGPTRWWSLIQNSNLGNSYAVTTLLDSPEKLRNIVSNDEHGGAFRHVFETYAIGEVSAGKPVKLSEKKMLLAGGLYNDMHAYDGLFARLDSFPGLDLSISYDIGAELNGVAAAYLADKRRIAARPGAAPVIYKPETRAWVDAILQAYLTNFVVRVGGKYPYIFSRGEAFTLLAVDTMYSATGDSHYLEVIRNLANVLLTFQARHGSSVDTFICNGNDSFMDCQAAGIIAMARAAVATGNKRYAQSARRALNAYRIDPDADTGHDVYIHIRPTGRDRDSYYWIYKAGLLLRSLESMEVLSERGLLKLKGAEWTFIKELQSRALNYVARTVHARGNLDELFTCHRSSETNSETQAWALLGLYRIEHERTEGR